MARVLGTDVSLLQIYDHIERGWFAISFVVMGLMAVGLVLALFLLGERPLGLRLFKGKNQTPGEEKTLEGQTPKYKTPNDGPAVAPSDSVTPVPEHGK